MFQYPLPILTQPQAIDFKGQLPNIAITAGIAVKPGHGRGIDEVLVLGIDPRHFGCQPGLPFEHIFLVVIFPQGECAQRQYLGPDGPSRLFSQSRLGGIADPLLLFIVVEHGIHVLAHPALAGGCVAAPEHRQKIRIADHPGIVVHLDSLGVVADITVIRIFLLAAGIPHPGANDAFDHPKLGFDVPESPQAKGCRFVFCRRKFVDGRQPICFLYILCLCIHFMVPGICVRLSCGGFAVLVAGGEQRHQGQYRQNRSQPGIWVA